MTVPLADIHPRSQSCWTEEYCLRHCDGYVVSGPGGPLGYVDDVVLSDAGDPTVLVVYGEGHLVVPIELVEGIDREGEVVFLRDVPPIAP